MIQFYVTYHISNDIKAIHDNKFCFLPAPYKYFGVEASLPIRISVRTMAILTRAFCICTLQNLQPKGDIQGGSNMTGTDLCVNKPHCAAVVRP